MSMQRTETVAGSGGIPGARLGLAAAARRACRGVLHGRARAALASAWGDLDAVIILLRPLEWPKNLVVAVPLLLAPELVSAASGVQVVLAFAVLALLSGVAYGVNDILDREADRDRPGGRERPLADGRLTPARALPWLAFLLATSLLGAVALGTGFAVVAALFLSVQGCYSLGRRRLVGVEVVLLALLLVLRIDAGAVVIGVAAGPHLLALIVLLALFVTLCRRRHEMALPLGPSRGRWSGELGRRYLDVVISGLLCGLVAGYVLVVGRDEQIQAAGGAWAYLSALFVLAGLLRFWHLTVIEQRPVGVAHLLWRDRVLAAALHGWLVAIVLTLHL